MYGAGAGGWLGRAGGAGARGTGVVGRGLGGSRGAGLCVRSWHGGAGGGSCSVGRGTDGGAGRRELAHEAAPRGDWYRQRWVRTSSEDS